MIDSEERQAFGVIGAGKSSVPMIDRFRIDSIYGTLPNAKLAVVAEFFNPFVGIIHFR